MPLQDQPVAGSFEIDLTQGKRLRLKVWDEVRRYGVALVCVGVAFAMRYWLTPILGEELPFMLFVAAALIAAWYGGAIPGIAALAIGLVVGDHFFLRHTSQSTAHQVETFRFIRYFFTASLGIVLIEVLHRGRRRTQAAVEKLEIEVERRERSEAALQTAQLQLKKHADELEQRVAERTAKLNSTVKSLEGLLYHIAHNLRAPLRTMSAFTTLLVNKAGSNLDEAGRDFSQRIVQAARHMDDLIHDLLEYGRISHTELTMDLVDLGQPIERALSRLAYQIQTAQAHVETIRPFPVVKANDKLLEQILVNLLENGLKFTNLGTAPRIRIWAEARTRNVRLWIQDNGIGIDPNYYERIFQPFERLHSDETYEGNGIGLAIVKEGIERMGGQAGVESESGKGSRFWIQFPSE
jgi:signal transduction histidine kinase